MHYQDIIYQVDDPVAVIKFNRPEALNAFTSRMLAEIRHALAAAETDEKVVGIILTGEGRGFCPGMDMNALNAISDGDAGKTDDLAELKAKPGDPELGDNFQVTYSYLMSIRKPVIAAINGACAGLGLAIASMTDLRIVERSAKFSTAFSQRGLIAEHGISWTLPRLIGSGNALDLLWSARKFTGEEAKEIGLAEKLVEDGESLATAIDYVRNLAASSAPKSLQVMKAQIYRHMNMQLGDAMRETNDWMAASLQRDDFREGVRSFIEKRPPNFERVKAAD
ncbi:MAG TPA: enoyl-CoA hydratase [Gammaproteobacteria bacterium]|nr:enoyl-CoA hydratase [Gammaproteobacteria bacterium]